MFEKFGNERCYIIAEIGGNFTTYKEAIKLVDGAKYAGVNAIKLQTFKAETISSKGAYFDMENTGKISQFEYFKKYEISKALHKKIFDYADSIGLDWFSTPSHPIDVDMLMSLNVPVFKIGADDATNIPLLKYVAKTGKPIILSTGICTLDEIREAVSAICDEGNGKIAILHTVSGYPTHSKDVNLNILNTLKLEFPEYPIGFSDHTLTTTAAIAAATMGAVIVERHFTLDKASEGPDHIISSTLEEMKYIVDTIREIEIMKGSKRKEPFGPELENRKNNRKSIVAIKKISRGEVLSPENIYVKRPGTGIPPKYLQQLFGKMVKRNFIEDEILNWGDFE